MGSLIGLLVASLVSDLQWIFAWVNLLVLLTGVFSSEQGMYTSIEYGDITVGESSKKRRDGSRLGLWELSWGGGSLPLESGKPICYSDWCVLNPYRGCLSIYFCLLNFVFHMWRTMNQFLYCLLSVFSLINFLYHDKRLPEFTHYNSWCYFN